MSDKLKVISMLIKNYKNIVTASIELIGRHIVIRGKCGAGKSNLFEALKINWVGATAIPKGPSVVTEGSDSSLIVTRLGSGSMVKFTVSTEIDKDGDIKLKIKEHSEDGTDKRVTGKEITFLKSLVDTSVFDVSAFRNMNAADQVQYMLNKYPETKAALEKINKEYTEVQTSRSVVLDNIKTKEVEIERPNPNVELGIIEITPTDLIEKMKAATSNNITISNLKGTIELKNSDIKRRVSELEQVLFQRSELIKRIAEMDKDILSKQLIIDVITEDRKALEEDLKTKKESDISAIEKEMSEINKKNELIRENARLNNLGNEVD
jgi:hypothetical protein